MVSIYSTVIILGGKARAKHGTGVSMAVRIINVDTPTLGDRGYIAHDGKDALVVDPQRDIDRFEKILNENGLKLHTVVETHMHNDYVSGGLVLARKHDAHYITSSEDSVGFERVPASDLEEFTIGSFAIRSLKTPGHTFTHLSYILLNEQSEAEGIFTGGSVLHGSTGRPDLLGIDKAPILAGLQHDTAHRIAEMLGENVSILPTHGFGSFCSATPTSGDSSFVSDEKKINPALLLDRERFITETLAGLDAFPAYYQHMGPANYAGAGPIDLSELKRISGDEVLKKMNAGAWIIDIRNRNKSADGHLKNSFNLGIDGSFATYLGWLFPYEKELVLISDSSAEIAVAQRELVRIAIDRPFGAYVGEISKIGDTVTTKKVNFSDVPEALKNEAVLVLDVRRIIERRTSHIAGTTHIPLHELAARIDELPTEREIWVHCGGAYRASAAIGILERVQLKGVLINEPYEAALKVSALHIITGNNQAGPVAPSVVKQKSK